MRKTPKQGRAAETVETILDAAAQLLEKSELREVSTNHIARKAGVSIGTLRSASRTDLEMMKSQEFEDQLVILMTAYIDQA